MNAGSGDNLIGSEDNILDGMSIGADAYIVKPFNVRILKASIANLLSGVGMALGYAEGKGVPYHRAISKYTPTWHDSESVSSSLQENASPDCSV